MNIDNLVFIPKNEWYVMNKRFSIEIKAWEKKDDKWVWNVYANIFENHPLFNDIELALGIPLHGGCTFNEIITMEPAQGIRYDWQKILKTLKIGCDYNHLNDDFFNECNPSDGIPAQIKKDVLKLYNFLDEINNEKSDNQ